MEDKTLIKTLTAIALGKSEGADARVAAIESLTYQMKYGGILAQPATLALQKICTDTDGDVRLAAIKALGH
jgi:hypothetical protein